MAMSSGNPTSTAIDSERFAHFAALHNIQLPMQAADAVTPSANAVPKPSLQRSASAKGTKKGNPSGTRTSVSRANCEIAGRSRCCRQARRNAMMLTVGKLSSSAPIRGVRRDISETATIVTEAIANLVKVIHMFKSLKTK